MLTVNFHLHGTVPTIMQAPTLANPLHPLKLELKKITDKRKKTETDHEEMARIEFLASLYYDEKLGPYWPGENVERMIRDAAKLSRRGEDVKRALMVVEDKIPLIYDGPRTPETLYADKRFVDMRPVVLKQARTMRCRPIFRDWEVKFTVAYDQDIFNYDTVVELVDTASRYVGLSSYRPRFGRFDMLEPALDAAKRKAA